MEKLLLITTIAFATMAAAPTASVQPALVSAQPAAAASPQGGDAPAIAQAPPAAEEKKICKLLPTSGTRMSKRACLTDKEWKQVEAEVESDNGY